VGVGITAPLWRKQLKGQNVETEARREIEGVSREASERRIMAQIETAYANVKAAEAQVRLFEGTLLREIEDQIQISLLGYQHGKIDALNLLDIFRTYTETKGEYLKSLYLFLCGLAELEAAGEEYE
jgi:cobalt-zinc-cadmium efflux system outer membrane protein